VIVAAVDWSGALAGERRAIWTAVADPGGLRRLECGRDRRETIDALRALAREGSDLVVGLDFAFSFPAWFPRERGIDDAPALWEHVAREGEAWLRACEPPFWGRPGKRRPDLGPGRSPWRRTESARKPSPKSVFQVGGAGAVGTGSLRGMPWLRELRAAGFAIWPFDPPRPPMVLEIYPRWMVGRTSVTSANARRLHLERRFAREDRTLLDRAAASGDAFDAAVSALSMAAREGELARLPPARDAIDRLEGRILGDTVPGTRFSGSP